MKKLFALLIASVLINATADAVGTRSAIVAWLPNPTEENITAYRVYQGTNSTGLFTFAGTTATTNLVVNGIGPQAYWFRVTSVNAGGESDPSDAAMLAAVPTKPGSVTVTTTLSLTNIVVIQMP